ncbi:hypothetical protein GF407_08960 [candidate division KSB1 bacterium]|nr:hypothetical protein [candidate division KSB1 bacterium]
MISCTEFIPAYNELFRFLHHCYGKESVVEFWHHLSDTFLDNLRRSIAEHGLKGCFIYWSRTLQEEAADFSMDLDEKKGVFRIIMNRCPSLGRLLESEFIEPYPDYCRHCDHLYRRIAESFGLEFDLTFDAKRAFCILEIRTCNY